MNRDFIKPRRHLHWFSVWTGHDSFIIYRIVELLKGPKYVKF